MKKTKKQMMGIAQISLVGAGASIGVSALGGNAAGISNATRYTPMMGTMVGIGGLSRMIDKSFKRKKRK